MRIALNLEGESNLLWAVSNRLHAALKSARRLRLCRELLREFNVSVEKLAWLVMASFVLLSSPMLFRASGCGTQFNKASALRNA